MVFFPDHTHLYLRGSEDVYCSRHHNRNQFYHDDPNQDYHDWYTNYCKTPAGKEKYLQTDRVPRNGYPDQLRPKPKGYSVAEDKYTDPMFHVYTEMEGHDHMIYTGYPIRDMQPKGYSPGHSVGRHDAPIYVGPYRYYY